MKKLPATQFAIGGKRFEMNPQNCYWESHVAQAENYLNTYIYTFQITTTQMIPKATRTPKNIMMTFQKYGYFYFL